MSEEVWNPELKFESVSFYERAAQKIIGKPEFKTYAIEGISV